MRHRELGRQPINIVKVSVRLVFMFLVQLGFVKGRVREGAFGRSGSRGGFFGLGGGGHGSETSGFGCCCSGGGVRALGRVARGWVGERKIFLLLERRRGMKGKDRIAGGWSDRCVVEQSLENGNHKNRSKSVNDPYTICIRDFEIEKIDTDLMNLLNLLWSSNASITPLQTRLHPELGSHDRAPFNSSSSQSTNSISVGGTGSSGESTKGRG